MSNIPNPKTQYTTEDFPKQYQEPPALQKQMNPLPDCGETNYTDSGRLKGRKALVTGGDSGIGRAAAIAYAREGATIITTTSVEGFDPNPILLDYAETKYAIIGFTKALSKQLADKGIRVNSIAPGPIWTPLQISGGQPQENIPEFGKNIPATPLGRAGQPVELAPVYVFLALTDSSHVTGQVYGITGGMPTA